MYARRNLNSTEVQVLNKYKLTDVQVIAFTDIYNFIGRFAYILEDFRMRTKFNWQDVRVGGQHIPNKTQEILVSVGSRNIAKYFSIHAYPKKFSSFVGRLIEKNKKIVMSDFIADGTISYEPIKVEVVEYNSSNK